MSGRRVGAADRDEGARRAVVASGHPLTSRAGVDVLAAGGNAFDAVVAAGFASSVVEPMLTSAAGGGFCLVHPVGGPERIVDFFVDVPGRNRHDPAPDMVRIEVAFASSTQVFHGGWGSVAVPGCLDGWLHLHDAYGRLPLADVVAPALRAAREGATVNAQQAALSRILAPIVAVSDDVAARFGPGGAPLAVGDVVVQTELADFLERLSHDPEGARQEFGAALVAGTGGAVTTDDLAAYVVVERAPLLTRYRDHELVTNPAPGGRLIADQLAILAAGPPVAGWDDVDAPWRFVGAQLAAEGRAERAATQGTTHVSVADTEGNVASMTTSNGTGSGCALPGLGVLANNMLGEEDLFPGGLGSGRPGQRIASMMSPTSLRHDDRIVVSLGSGGSERIRTALTQVLARLVDHERDLSAAVTGPRVHHDGSTVQIEPGFPAAAVAALAERHRVNEWAALDLYFGGVHAVAPDGAAAGDPRRGGAVATV